MKRSCPPSRAVGPVGLALAALLAFLPVLTGCAPGAPERRSRPAGSAVWIDPRVAPVTAASIRPLRASGIEEVFVAAADLSFGSSGIEFEPWSIELSDAAPRRTPTTLAVLGDWPPPRGLEPERAGAKLGEALSALRRTARDSGLLPVGIHLHLMPHAAPVSTVDEGARLELLGELVRRLGRALPPDVFLSVSLHRSWLDAPGARLVAQSADFVVPFLYGQPPGEPDRADDWDPERTEADLARVDALEVDYLLGVRTIGSASRLDASGDVVEATTRASLGDLARNPDLRRGLGDAFGGVGRLAYVFQAQRRTGFAGWEVAPGEAIRVVRTSPGLLFNLRRRARDAASERLLGLLFHRLPDPEEAELSPDAEGIVAVLGQNPPSPDIRPRLVIRSIRGQTAVLGISLENRSSLSTDLALGDGNYLSVRTEGAVVEGVEPGGFTRYSLWREGREVRPGIGWREPDQVRLYTPIVTGSAKVGEASVELRLRRQGAAAFLSGRFYSTDGRELEIERVGGVLNAVGGPGATAE